MYKSCLLFLGLSLSVGHVQLVAAETEEFDLQKGRKVFETTCFACHGPKGKGAIPGVPDMTKKDSRLLQPLPILEKNVRDGYQSPGSPLAMPPNGGNPTLTDEDIKNAIGYMKGKFAPNNKDAPTN